MPKEKTKKRGGFAVGQAVRRTASQSASPLGAPRSSRVSRKTDRSQDRRESGRETERKRERGRKGEERPRLYGPRLWKPFTERAGKGSGKGWHGRRGEGRDEAATAAVPSRCCTSPERGINASAKGCTARSR